MRQQWISLIQLSASRYHSVRHASSSCSKQWPAALLSANFSALVQCLFSVDSGAGLPVRAGSGAACVPRTARCTDGHQSSGAGAARDSAWGAREVTPHQVSTVRKMMRLDRLHIICRVGNREYFVRSIPKLLRETFLTHDLNPTDS